MDLLTLLGIVSTGAAIIFYHLEPRHSLWVLGFALASLSSAIYAFLQGAWPFGVAEMFWFGVALHRYSLLTRGGGEFYRFSSAEPEPQTGPEALAPPAVAPPAHCHAGGALRPISWREQRGAGADAAPGPRGSGRVARVS